MPNPNINRRVTLSGSVQRTPVPSYDPDAEAFFARLPDPISNVLKALYSSFFLGVKTFNGLDQISEGADYMYFFGGLTTEDNAKVNAISASFPITVVGSPTWANTGYTGGVGNYLKNAYIDTNDAEAFRLIDGIIGVYCTTEGANGSEFEVGNLSDDNVNISSFVGARYTGSARGELNLENVSSECAVVIASAIGYTSIERFGTAKRLWRDEDVINTNLSTPTFLVQYENYILAVNYLGVTPLRYSTKEVYFVIKGRATRLDQADLSYRLELLRAGTVWTPKPVLGVIFSDSFARASLGSDYTSSGGWACNGTNLVATNALNDWTKELTYSVSGYRTNLEKTIYRLNLEVSSTSDKGVAIGYKGSYFDLQVSFEFDSGNIFFYNGLGTNTLSTSAGTLAITAGDQLQITVKNHKERFECWVYNVDTATTIYHEYAFSYDSPIIIDPPARLRPQNYAPALYAIGGTVNVTYWEFYSYAQKNVDVVFVGDSNFSCCFPGYSGNRMCEIAGRGKYYEIYAGPGNKTSDINWTEVLALNPAHVVVNLGTNDTALSVALSTSMANLSAGRTIVTSGGAQIHFCQIPPLNTNDVNPYNTGTGGLVDTFGAEVDIDLYTPFVGVGFQFDATYSPDGVHVNALGQPLGAAPIAAVI